MLIAIQVKFPNLLLAKTTRKSFTILSSRHNRFHKPKTPSYACWICEHFTQYILNHETISAVTETLNNQTNNPVATQKLINTFVPNA